MKDGKINPPAKSGNHIAKYDIMSSGLEGLRLGNSPYFFHEHFSSTDRNFGCLAMKTEYWTSFVSTISKTGHSSFGYNLNKTAIINVSIIATPYPKIKF